jgi:hypothetical protein
MKIIYVVLFFIICSSYSCATYNRAHKWNTLIEGKWQVTTKHQSEYPTIQFSRGGALFKDSKDSISVFACKMKNNNLILKGAHKTYKHNIILTLTKDSLIFHTLLENTTLQVYLRKNK